jgi:hypothetical protein
MVGVVVSAPVSALPAMKLHLALQGTAQICRGQKILHQINRLRADISKRMGTPAMARPRGNFACLSAQIGEKIRLRQARSAIRLFLSVGVTDCVALTLSGQQHRQAKGATAPASKALQIHPDRSHWILCSQQVKLKAFHYVLDHRIAQPYADQVSHDSPHCGPDD